MPVPKWRVSKDSDDGCTIYQCLSCYNDWESRTSPASWGGKVTQRDDGKWWWNTEYGSEQGPFDSCEEACLKTFTWRFCPYCGIEWQGQQISERVEMLQNLPYKCYWDDPESQSEYDNEKIWVIQKKTTYRYDTEPSHWYDFKYCDLHRFPTVLSVFTLLKNIRSSWEQEKIKWADEWGETYETTKEYRAVLKKRKEVRNYCSRAH
jgi:hypothetical protein